MKKECLFLTLALLFTPVQAQNAAIDGKNLKALILQDVRQQGLDKLANVQAAVVTAQEAIWVKVWEQSVLKANPITLEHREAAYKELVTLLGTTEYRFITVVVRNQDQAKFVIEKMRANAAWEQLDFNAMVNADPSFKMQKTAWVNMTMLMPEFRAVVQALKVGEVSAAPVKAQELWHVIGLLETRPLVSPTFDQIKQNVEKLAEQKVIGEKINNLLSKK